ncbi:hypothetical protein BH09BAC1_BH09BAC1_11060 [soil metagenome]
MLRAPVNTDGHKKHKLKLALDGEKGYGAFSYAHSQIDEVYKYILNQEEHHKKQTFRDEYLNFLKRFEVEYDEKYLFDFLE